MAMEATLKIEHNYVTFYERIKSLILNLIGLISLFGIFSMFSSKMENIGAFIIFFSLVFGFITAIKIYRNWFYIFSFYCDSKNVRVCYLKGSKEHSFETTIDKIDISFRNTSSRAGFDCEIIFRLKKLNFVITKDFDWNFEEMKQLFEYVKLYKEEKITDKENSIIQSIENYLEKYPF